MKSAWVAGFALAFSLGHAEAKEVSPAGSALENLEALYTTLSAVSLKAGVTIERRDQSPIVYGHGEFEYVADDVGRYRLRYEIDPRLGLLGNAEIAFDGSQFQHLFGEQGALALEAEEPPISPIAMPNPFLVPLRFLEDSPNSDLVQIPRLELAKNPQRWSRLHQNRRRSDQPSEALIGGGDSGGSRVFRISLDEVGNIDRIGEEDGLGKVLTEVLLSHYHEYGDRAFPHTITLTQFHPESGEAIQVVRYEILELVFDGTLRQGDFRIDRSKATSLWDGESNSFVEMN